MTPKLDKKTASGLEVLALAMERTAQTSGSERCAQLAKEIRMALVEGAPASEGKISMLDRINAIGEPIDKHIFAGVFEGVAVALYKIDAESGCNYCTALIDPDETQVMPTTNEAEARESYWHMVHTLNARQEADTQIRRRIAALSVLPQASATDD